MKIAFINGFRLHDKGGVSTISYELSKFFDVDSYGYPENIDALNFKSVLKSKKYDLIIAHLVLENKKSLEIIDDALKYIKRTQNTHLIYLEPTRSTLHYNQIEIMNYINYFDEIWYYNRLFENIFSDFKGKKTCIDFNIFKTNNIIELNKNRPKTIGYTCRDMAFKGIFRLTDVLKERELKYPFLYFGSAFDVKTWGEKNIVRGPLWIINKYCNSVKDKTPNGNIKFQTDFNVYENNSLNIYPRYNQEELKDIFNKIGVAFCPTLGRVNKNTDDKYIFKNSSMWENALEYANCELINNNVPVMFSKDFALMYDEKMLDLFPDLIYENIEDGITFVENNFDRVLLSQPEQKKWFINKMNIVRDNLIKKVKDLENEV